MCRRQHAGILHVILQVPELRQTNTSNVDNVCRICDGDLRIRTLESRDKGEDEVEEVVVEGEEGKQLGRSVELLVTWKAVLVFLRVFLVFGDMFAVEMLDHEHVDRDTATVSMAGPLRILFRSVGCVKEGFLQLTISLALS